MLGYFLFSAVTISPSMYQHSSCSLDNQQTLTQLLSKRPNTTVINAGKVAESSAHLSEKHLTNKQGSSSTKIIDNQVIGGI